MSPDSKIVPAQEVQMAEIILAPWLNPEEPIDYTAGRIKLTGNGRFDSLELTISADELLTVVAAIMDNNWGYLGTITGVDLGPEAGEMEILYHFCRGTAVITLYVTVPRENAVLPSVCGLIPSASFFERELREMLGVTITNTPNTDHLFLPDNWPDGVYPLRKDFQMAAR